jgi:F-type H+-transporting ATPase subunit delta
MNNSKISVRYAKALFLSAKEAKLLERVVEDVKLLSISYQVKGFKDFLESPIIKTSEKKKVVNEVFAKSITSLSNDFINLVISNKRENYLEAINRNFIALYRKEKGIKGANLRVPDKASNDHINRFIAILEEFFHAKIELEEVVDESLIGGFIIQVDDKQLDASVKTSLGKIKKKLLETAIEK